MQVLTNRPNTRGGSPHRTLRARTWAAMAVVALAGAAVLAISPAPAAARQATTDARWLPWIGCWEALLDETEGMQASAEEPSGLVCVRPSGYGDGVHVTAFTAEDVVYDRELFADGAPRHFAEGGCSGWEQMRWSEDGKRLYTRSDLECGPGLRRESTGVLAILPGGEWLDVQVVRVGEDHAMRIRRYGAVADHIVRAEGIESPGRDLALAIATARAAAASPLTPADVADAARHVDVEVVEAMLLEQGTGFDLDGAALAELADAGVPERITDLMLALTYPDRFDADPHGTAIVERAREPERVRVIRHPVYLGCDPFGFDPYRLASYRYYVWPTGWGLHFGWHGHRLAFGYIWGPRPVYYSPYGFRDRWSRWYPRHRVVHVVVRPRPIIRVPAKWRSQYAGRGVIVKDRGYTRPGWTGRGARPRDDSTSRTTIREPRRGVETTPIRTARPRTGTQGPGVNTGGDRGPARGTLPEAGRIRERETSTPRVAVPRTAERDRTTRVRSDAPTRVERPASNDDRGSRSTARPARVQAGSIGRTAQPVQVRSATVQRADRGARAGGSTATRTENRARAQPANPARTGNAERVRTATPGRTERSVRVSTPSRRSDSKATVRADTRTSGSSRAQQSARPARSGASARVRP